MTLHRKNCEDWRNPLQATLKCAKDNLEKDYEYCKHILWSYKTKLKLFGHRNAAY